MAVFGDSGGYVAFFSVLEVDTFNSENFKRKKLDNYNWHILKITRTIHSINTNDCAADKLSNSPSRVTSRYRVAKIINKLSIISPQNEVY